MCDRVYMVIAPSPLTVWCHSEKTHVENVVVCYDYSCC